jgi:signal transduction histidine kinase
LNARLIQPPGALGRGAGAAARALFELEPRRVFEVYFKTLTANDEWQVGGEFLLEGVYLPVMEASTQKRVGEQLWLSDASIVSMTAPAPGASRSMFQRRDAIWLVLLVMAATAWWWRYGRQRRTLNELESTLAFSRAQLAKAENEQARIARDLHDGVIQSIYAVGMRIEECRRLTDASPKAANDKLAATGEVLNQVIRDVRGFLTGLETASIQGRELKTALKSLLIGLGDEASERVSLQIESLVADSMTSKDATEVFHICKEALSNSFRHGNAARVTLRLLAADNCHRLEIADDGIGFNPETVKPEGRGLQNIRTRARTLGAQLQLTTAPDSGTRLVLLLPKN